MKKIIVSLFVPFVAFMVCLSLYTVTQPATTKEVYTITQNDSEGLQGTANDNTGLYITKVDLNKLSKQELKTGDQIKVTFADYETIVKVEKVN